MKVNPGGFAPTPEMDGGDDIQQKAEKFSNAATDAADNFEQAAKDAAAQAPKDAKVVASDPRFNSAYKTKEKVKQKMSSAEKKAKQTEEDGKIKIDFDRYAEFVDQTCSNPSKDYNVFRQHMDALEKKGCKINRLDTAASGMSAEGGEFMEIVKKIKYQGKPWNEDTKDHLIKELGDVLWYAQNACAALDIRMDEVIYINTLKLAARYPKMKFDEYYSENRKPGDI